MQSGPVPEVNHKIVPPIHAREEGVIEDLCQEKGGWQMKSFAIHLSAKFAECCKQY